MVLGNYTYLLVTKHSIKVYTSHTLIEQSVVSKSIVAGYLVVDYISTNDGTMEDYVSGLSATVNSYNGYNLLMGDFG